MARLLRAAIFIAFIFSAKSAFAACHAVTPSGSGSKTGADWNNAYAGLPATLIRGDVYYLADGSYGSYTMNTPTSGTTTIEIRKAQSYDNCTSTGWNTSTMGSAQAIFSGGPSVVTLTTAYFVLNGNGLQTTPGCGGAPGAANLASPDAAHNLAEPPSPLDCGIRVQNTCSSSSADACDNTLNCKNGSNLTAKYVELIGNGQDQSDQSEIYGLGGCGSLSISHMYGHYAGCTYGNSIAGPITVDHSYFWGTEVNGGGSCHGQAFYTNSGGGQANQTWTNNVFQDITGTAVWTIGQTAATTNNLVYYNNVIWFSAPVGGPSASWGAMIGDAVVDCINGATCTNAVFVQNTIINCPLNGVFQPPAHCGVNLGGGTGIVENNIYYDSASGSISQFGGTEDYNSFLNSPSNAGSGSHDVQNTSSGNPFVNWQAGNFNLASENASWGNRLALGAPYTVDPNGIVRTTDRGGYQYSGTQSQAPNPPSGLLATVK